jgi:hypothetical protein
LGDHESPLPARLAIRPRPRQADDVIPFADSEERVRNDELPAPALIEVGSDHASDDQGDQLTACFGHSSPGSKSQ